MMTYNENLQYFLVEGNLRNDGFLNNHLIVFDIESNNRRKIFQEYISKTGWRKYENTFNADEKEQYEFVYYRDEALSSIKLYNILKEHNKKVIIFDNDAVIKKKALLQILEGGVCSSPDSCSKWPVRLDNKPEFYFKGIIIILTSLDKDEFKRKEKFKYLIRDCVTA